MTEYKKTDPQKPKNFTRLFEPKNMTIKNYLAAIIECADQLPIWQDTPEYIFKSKILEYARKAWGLVPEEKDRGFYLCFRCDKSFYSPHDVQPFLDPDGKRFLYCATCVHELGDKFYETIPDKEHCERIKKWAENEK